MVTAVPPVLNSPHHVTHRTRIKICGVCRPEDAVLAARAGADAIGIVFHEPSRRNVSLPRAREILAALPPFVSPVGLFVDAEFDTVVDTADELGLRYVQLHGAEEPEYVDGLKPLTVIKAVRVSREDMIDELDAWREMNDCLHLTNLAGFVLETAGTAAPGGTGVANDWEAVRDAQRAGAFNRLPPIIAAGGLRHETVGDVVRTVRPFAVDVSSGVEEALGVKSEAKVRAFVDAVRAADAAV
jgi:phosphoribosylanthranilate isomerase